MDIGFTAFVKVDSVKKVTDSLYYFQKEIQNRESCFKIGFSWIGDNVVIKSTGDNLFFNRNYDTITIKTLAKLNDSWLAMERKNSLKVIAQVTKHDTVTFLGIKDSVKTISFKVYDYSMTPITSDLNNLTIQVSKNYGLVKTLNFLLFPDFGELSPSPSNLNILKELKLVGLSNPKLGVQNLTWFDAFDFQVGDILHIYEEDSYSQNPQNATITKTIQKCISRINYPDSIMYVFDNEELIKTTKTGTLYTYIHDTINLIVKANTEFDKLPGVIVYFDKMPNFAYTNVMTSSARPEKFREESSPFQVNEDTCMSEIAMDAGCNYKYQRGLGGPYFLRVEMTTGKYYERTVKYYKKGSETWGTPLIITNISEVKPNSTRVYPNPARDQINITVSSSNTSFTFDLMDVTGRLILKKYIKGANNTAIDVSNLKGLFLYKITAQNKVIASGKLIIK
jgi:hypothetical protein